MAAKKRELSEKELLKPQQRAEDILLGALGFSEDARIVSIVSTETGFEGKGSYSDGEEFSFNSDGELSPLEKWALEQLIEIQLGGAPAQSKTANGS